MSVSQTIGEQEQDRGESERRIAPQQHRRDQRVRRHRAARRRTRRAAPATPARRSPSAPSATSAIAVPGRANSQQQAAPTSATDAESSARDCGRARRPACPIPTARRAPRPSRTQRRRSRRNRRRRSRAAPAPARTAMRSTRLLRPAGTAARAACLGRMDARPRSGAGLRDQPAEPAFAPVIFGNRAFQRGAVEIRPIGRHEHQLAIGGLPEQEIRQPLLAAGADDEVGVGQVRRVEVLADQVGGDRFEARCAPALTSAASRARGARDLLARAVVEGDDQREPVVVLGQLLGLLQQSDGYPGRDRRARRSRAP